MVQQGLCPGGGKAIREFQGLQQIWQWSVERRCKVTADTSNVIRERDIDEKVKRLHDEQSIVVMLSSSFYRPICTWHICACANQICASAVARMRKACSGYFPRSSRGWKWRRPTLAIPRFALFAWCERKYEDDEKTEGLLRNGLMYFGSQSVAKEQWIKAYKMWLAGRPIVNLQTFNYFLLRTVFPLQLQQHNKMCGLTIQMGVGVTG